MTSIPIYPRATTVVAPMVRAEVIVRTQHAAGSWPHKGPDTYVMVLCAAPDQEIPRIMRRDLLDRRGIAWSCTGEGYSRHDGPRSSLGRAIAEAEALAERVRQIPVDVWRAAEGSGPRTRAEYAETIMAVMRDRGCSAQDAVRVMAVEAAMGVRA